MTDNNDLIVVKACLRLKTAAEGGRASAIRSGYRPNHVFERPKGTEPFHSYIGDIIFDEQEFIQPGETTLVKVRFLKNSILEKYMNIGQNWLIQEGPRVVAEGKIIEIEQQ